MKLETAIKHVNIWISFLFFYFCNMHCTQVSLTLTSEWEPKLFYSSNICSKRKSKDTKIPTIFYSFKRYQIKLISFESVPSNNPNSSNKLHLQRSFHFILNFLQFVKHGKSNMIVVWYLIKLEFCVHFKLKISLYENLVYVSAFLVNATTLTVHCY